jgi:phage-related tail protein
MVASLTDEGEQGIAAIAGLANATDSDLKQAVQNWKTLQNEQKATSESVGELKTQFTERVNEMLESFKSTVADMNLSNEARASAESTINSFIKAADDMRGPVREAYARLAREAINQLNTVKSTISSAYSTIGAGTSPGNGSAHFWANGFASGTPDAPSGWAWVGEQGPELINLHGGEAILPADASMAFAAAAAMPEMQITAFAPQVIGAIGAYANPPVQAESAIYAPAASASPTAIINVHIDGNATPETVDRLYDFRDEMLDMMREVMAEEQIAARRNVYI